MHPTSTIVSPPICFFRFCSTAAAFVSRFVRWARRVSPPTPCPRRGKGRHLWVCQLEITLNHRLLCGVSHVEKLVPPGDDGSVHFVVPCSRRLVSFVQAASSLQTKTRLITSSPRNRRLHVSSPAPQPQRNSNTQRLPQSQRGGRLTAGSCSPERTARRRPRRSLAGTATRGHSTEFPAARPTPTLARPAPSGGWHSAVMGRQTR